MLPQEDQRDRQLTQEENDALRKIIRRHDDEEVIRKWLGRWGTCLGKIIVGAVFLVTAANALLDLRSKLSAFSHTPVVAPVDARGDPRLARPDRAAPGH